LQLLRNSLLPDPQGRCCLAQKTAAFVVTWRVEMKRAASEEDSLACAGCGVAPPEGKRHMSCPLCEDLQFPMIHFCSMNCPANPWPGHWIWHDEQNAGAVQVQDDADETLQQQQAQEQSGTSGEHSTAQQPHMNMPAPHAEASPEENKPSTTMPMPSVSISTSEATVMVQTPLLAQPLPAITVTQVMAQPPPRATSTATSHVTVMAQPVKTVMAQPLPRSTADPLPPSPQPPPQQQLAPFYSSTTPSGLTLAQSVKSVFMTHVMCDFTPRRPSALPKRKWTTLEQLLDRLQLHAPREVLQLGPNPLRQLITEWYKDHPAFKSLPFTSWGKLLKDMSPQARPRSLVFTFCFEYTPGAAPGGSSTPPAHLTHQTSGGAAL
jgi:hypothetical protein